MRYGNLVPSAPEYRKIPVEHRARRSLPRSARLLPFSSEQEGVSRNVNRSSSRSITATVRLLIVHPYS